jgi:hypothetical protein
VLPSNYEQRRSRSFRRDGPAPPGIIEGASGPSPQEESAGECCAGTCRCRNSRRRNSRRRKRYSRERLLGRDVACLGAKASDQRVARGDRRVAKGRLPNHPSEQACHYVERCAHSHDPATRSDQCLHDGKYREAGWFHTRRIPQTALIADRSPGLAKTRYMPSGARSLKVRRKASSRSNFSRQPSSLRIRVVSAQRCWRHS